MILLLLACTPSPVSPLSGVVVDDATFDGCGCIGTRCDLRHVGVDLNAPVGTPVLAVADGEVIFVAGPDQADGWGRGNYALFVRHNGESGPFVSVYGHIHTELRPGDVVASGSEVATVGRYEEVGDDGVLYVYLSHLHFGVHPGAGMPSGPTGLVGDPLCDGGETYGWVAPGAFFRAPGPHTVPATHQIGDRP